MTCYPATLKIERFRRFDKFRTDADKLEEIIRECCDYAGVNENDVLGHCRKPAFALARHLAFYFATMRTNWGLKKIASWFSDRDHTTVMHGRDKIIKALAKESPNKLKEAVEVINSRLPF